MRSEWICSVVPGGKFLIRRRISAGRSFVTEVKRYFQKNTFELREFVKPDSDKYTVVMSYPFVEGRSWRTEKDGRVVKICIESTSAIVKVKAGEFGNCMKISEHYLDLPGSTKYNYYAPEVGWVLTTTALVGGTEHRSSELLSYKIIPNKDQG
ncbi:MAG: hypothetical protein ABIH42_08170 [Planctomycetota bacterium]